MTYYEKKLHEIMQMNIPGGWVVDRSGGYKGAKQRVVALKICTFFGAYVPCT